MAGMLGCRGSTFSRAKLREVTTVTVSGDGEFQRPPRSQLLRAFVTTLGKLGRALVEQVQDRKQTWSKTRLHIPLLFSHLFAKSSWSQFKRTFETDHMTRRPKKRF